MSSRVLVYGGRGALGGAIVTKFKESGWWVANVDMKNNDDADENIQVSGDSWTEQVIVNINEVQCIYIDAEGK